MTRIVSVYHGRPELQACEQHKEPQRRRVVEFLAQNMHRNCYWYLGLPGEHWLTEKLLKAHWQKLLTVGVECNRKVFDRSRRLIPGRFRNTANAEMFECQVTDEAELIATQLSHFMTKTNRKFTAMWLDFTSTFGEEVITCCRNIGRLAQLKPTPFAVTFSMGREKPGPSKYLRLLGGSSGTALARRANALRIIVQTSTARPVRICDVWQYRSYHGTAMGNITGIVE